MGHIPVKDWNKWEKNKVEVKKKDNQEEKDKNEEKAKNEVDKKGTPRERWWTNRLKDAKIDGCIEVVKKTKTKKWCGVRGGEGGQTL